MYDIKDAALRALAQQSARGVDGGGGDGDNNNNNNNNNNFVCDMFDMEFGDGFDVPDRKDYQSGAQRDVDLRTLQCEVFPGGMEDWGFDVGVRVSCPAILKRPNRRRVIARLKPGKLFAALAYKKDSSAAFIVDSGAFKTQVPETMKHKLRNVTRIRAIPLETAGDNSPTCREVGYMDFMLPGRDEIYTVECLVRPGRSQMCLFALRDFERLEPPEGRFDGRQAVQVMFEDDYICFGKVNIPLTRVDDMPMVIPEIVSGSKSCVYASSVGTAAGAAAAASCSHAEELVNWEYVHRVLAHASDGYCERTVKKAKGLPTSLRKPEKPCPECALGKMKAPRRGQGELSTGLPASTKPGEQFHTDIFGPLSVPGLRGERYFITLSCSYSGWGAVRCMTSKDQAGKMIESMILEARTTGKLDSNPSIVHTSVLHSDNDSVFRSKEYQDRMTKAHVKLHFAATSEPRTNPYSERFGGVLLPMVRALLLEGSLPSKYWTVMLQHACWINNRLVRAKATGSDEGRAPIELFAPHLDQPIDFSRVYPVGVLAYWPLSKVKRDDPKLGCNGVGVYLGPAEMRGQTGHLVLTQSGHVLCVAHVRVDTAVRPFLRGLVNVLSDKSVSSSLSDTTVDLAAFVLEDGVLAGDLIGAEVKQTFPGHCTFHGRVVDVHASADDPHDVVFETVYSDGDGEIIPYVDLKPLLVGPVIASASYASVEACVSGPRVPGYDLSKNMQELEDLNVSDETIKKASHVHNLFTYVSSRVWEATDVPPGSQYSWYEIWRMRPDDRARHVAAMQAEIDKLLAAGHAEWAELPAGEVAIPSVGVFRLKQHDLHADGEVLKARLCCNGQQAESSQPEGWETTANVASVAQILVIIAIATDLGLSLKQIDVKSAFTQVKLQEGETIYLRPLPALGDPEGKGRVLKLLHHLYGHPLANAAWSKMWLQIVTKFGFKVVDRQGTVFSYRDGDKIMLMATVVDDSVVAFNDKRLFKKFIKFVKNHVPIAVTDLQHICGLRVTRDMVNGVTKVDQSEYIEKKAKLFGIKGEGYVYNTPMECEFKLGERPAKADPKLVTEARSLNGSLIYATLTRPDVKYPCSKLATIVTNPTADDLSSMRRVLQYLYDTRDTCLTYKRGAWTGPDGTVHPANQLVVYVDAGFGREESRHSQTGFTVMLNGATVFAKSGKQTQIADSTGYAETIALHEASHWVIGYRRIMENLGFPQLCATPMYEDNSAAEAFAKRGMGPKSLHYEIKYLFVHDQQTRGRLNVCKIDTENQIADVLTKPVKWELAERLVSFLLGGPLVFSRGTRAS